jgi:hypothetical protein
LKKKIIIILLTIAASIWLGYLFFIGLFLGFLTTRKLAGKSAGEPGKVKSVIIPFRGWGIHLHHWLWSLGLIGFTSATGIYFLTSSITYGVMAGVIFQGIFCYSDWHIILVKRASKDKKPLLPAGEDAGLKMLDAPSLMTPEQLLSQAELSVDSTEGSRVIDERC